MTTCTDWFHCKVKRINLKISLWQSKWIFKHWLWIQYFFCLFLLGQRRSENDPFKDLWLMNKTLKLWGYRFYIDYSYCVTVYRQESKSPYWCRLHASHSGPGDSGRHSDRPAARSSALYTTDKHCRCPSGGLLYNADNLKCTLQEGHTQRQDYIIIM